MQRNTYEILCHTGVYTYILLWEKGKKCALMGSFLFLSLFDSSSPGNVRSLLYEIAHQTYSIQLLA